MGGWVRAVEPDERSGNNCSRRLDGRHYTVRDTLNMKHRACMMALSGWCGKRRKVVGGGIISYGRRAEGCRSWYMCAWMG